jgi:hypothetical protein
MTYDKFHNENYTPIVENWLMETDPGETLFDWVQNRRSPIQDEAVRKSHLKWFEIFYGVENGLAAMESEMENLFYRKHQTVTQSGTTVAWFRADYDLDKRWKTEPGWHRKEAWLRTRPFANVPD